MPEQLLKHPQHCVDLLREEAKQASQRAFVARGSNTTRCPSCLMAAFACFCNQRVTSQSNTLFTLLYHYTEIHKPTNSGRLIADLFPNQTNAHIWSRTEPSQALLDQIEAHQKNTIILYPATEQRLSKDRHLESLAELGAPRHVIILDATWRLASKMLHQSRWLDVIPTFAINEDVQRTFMVRQAKHEQQFATAEVVAMLLAETGERQQSQQLADYYQVFNTRSVMSRQRNQPKMP